MFVGSISVQLNTSIENKYYYLWIKSYSNLSIICNYIEILGGGEAKEVAAFEGQNKSFDGFLCIIIIKKTNSVLKKRCIINNNIILNRLPWLFTKDKRNKSSNHFMMIRRTIFPTMRRSSRS